MSAVLDIKIKAVTPRSQTIVAIEKLDFYIEQASTHNAKCGTDDERLIHMQQSRASIGLRCMEIIHAPRDQATRAKRHLEVELAKLAAFAREWVYAAVGDGTRAELDEAIRLERARQGFLLREGKIQFDCASPIVDVRRKNRTLLEEFLEVVREVDLAETCSKHELGTVLYDRNKELIQVAAVCVAWLESLAVQ